jgi:hypothetical protein
MPQRSWAPFAWGRCGRCGAFESDPTRCRGCAGYINIDNDASDTVNAAGSELGSLADCIVTDAAGEFNDPVMYLDADRTGNDTLFTIELGNDVLLHFHIVFHQVVPFLANQ